METSALLGSGNTKKYDIPVSHLDYDYIKSCNDVKILEKIYKTLKSGEEGCYPHLENFCEQKLSDLNPNSRVLRKETPISSRKDLNREDRELLDEDLKNWTESMKSVEDHLKTPSNPGLAEDDYDDLPPVRSGNITLTADGAQTSNPTAKPTNKRVMPREYRDWDKIDVDKELEKVDEKDDKSKQKTVAGNTVVKDIPTYVDTKGMTDSEKLLKANREKDKGNEAFRSSDFKEAITYYSRSISLQPTAASYNNRALAYLKNSDWQKALADCNKVLSLEPKNVKALLRRGTAYKSLKKYDHTLADMNKVLDVEPNNKRARDLIEETEKTREKENVERKTKGRRMKIEDVDEIEEETEEPPGEPAAGVAESEKPKSRKMKIEEVESDDEAEGDMEINGNKNTPDEKLRESNKPLVNGIDVPVHHATDKTVEDSTVKVRDSKTNEVSAKDDKTDVEEQVENSCTENKGTSNATESLENEINKTKTELNEESKNIDNEDLVNENTNTEKVAESVEQILARPVFYMKEYPGSCVAYREEANKLFKSGQYGEAEGKYSKVIALLEKLPEQVYNLALTYSNRAACHLKIGDLPGCVKDCNSSLELVPHSVKPLLRRATAYEHLERYKKAYVDYRHVLLLDNRTEQAHLGTKRCQAILSEKDGPRWREKLQLPQVSPWDIPDIIGLDGKPIAPASSSILNTRLPSSPITNDSLKAVQEASKTNQHAPTSTCPATNSESKPAKMIEKKEPAKVTVNKEPAMTPQEKFDAMKAKGNEHVKKSQFKDAIKCYSECSEILPDQTVSYTNRALCYIRENQAEDAEKDCSKALEKEKDNVKALFRRAQARKMLKRYREGIEDLNHLLKVEPTNAAAKKEMDVLKRYWREELESLKKDLPGKTGVKPGTSKQDRKPGSSTAQSGAGKQRKKIVIEEVESDDEEKTSTGAGPPGGAANRPDISKILQDPEMYEAFKDPEVTKAFNEISQNSENIAKYQNNPKIQKVMNRLTTQFGMLSGKGSKGSAGPSKEPQTSTHKQKSGSPIQEVHSKPVNQPSSNKPATDKSTTKPVKGKSETKQKPVNKKSQIKETSSGLPQVPKSVPKLDKATPYEFISRWNALKKSETVKPYYDLLKQIKPADIKTVISNKLDGGMLNLITKCVAEHYIENGEGDESYLILKNLSTVPRFGTVAMFMSEKEKSDVRAVMERLSSQPSKEYTVDDIKSLRKDYSV